MTLPLPDLGIKIASRLFLKAFFLPEMPPVHDFAHKRFFFQQSCISKSWKPANLLAKKIISPAFVSMSDYGIWVNFTGFKISWKAGGLKSPRPEKLV